MSILIVEDEQAIALGLKFNFEHEGYDVVLAGDGPVALEHFERHRPEVDLVVLDLMLPSMSGYEICRRIRALDDHVPILVLSARTLSEDRALAFDCGTDQYMTKPFALPELLSRVRNLIERHPRSARTADAARTKGGPETFEFGGVQVDGAAFQVRVRGKVHDLTTTEMQLLRHFIAHEGQVLARSDILADVWGADSDVTTRTIDNFVLRLRKLIETNPSEPRHFLSVRGTGYRFVARPDGATGDLEGTSGDDAAVTER
jgi:two-component system OmpR family response regulator